MRNLQLLYSLTSKFRGLKADLIAQHGFNEKLHFVYDSNIVKCINTDSGDVQDLCSYEDIVAMEFVQLNDCLCLATDKGEIIQYSFNDNDCEVVGLISDGIASMSWSPDQELVVFMTK